MSFWEAPPGTLTGEQIESLLDHDGDAEAAEMCAIHPYAEHTFASHFTTEEWESQQ